MAVVTLASPPPNPVFQILRQLSFLIYMIILCQDNRTGEMLSYTKLLHKLVDVIYLHIPGDTRLLLEAGTAFHAV